MSDTIDRQAAIDAIDSLYFDTVDDHDRTKERIKRLPSAQTERKKGKWIYHRDWAEEGSCGYECSV